MEKVEALDKFLQYTESKIGTIKGINYNTSDNTLESKILTALYEIDTHSYFRPKSFEFSKFYEYLGVGIFKKLVTFFKNPSGEGDNYFISKERSVDSLINFEKKTRNNETIHAYAMAVSVCWPVVSVINAYLVMLQRYNRARIVKTLQELLKEIIVK
ncbi:Uncharacterised protein [Candidatus Tiddalikarchaeum anstoanum]|nr:Uncharacterised protein [Candidatus Tiddalikarchaeum anstoanum]